MEINNTSYNSKSFDDLTFADDFMFCAVLTKRPDLLVELTELITGRKVKEIRNVTGQKTVRITHDGKGVRYDVYFEDDKANAVYDIEMQTTRKKNLPRRTRFYQSMVDSENLTKGVDYEKLPDSYIIFICLDDPFTKSLVKYSFEERCLEDETLTLNDGTKKIFVNAKGTIGEVSKDLKNFLDFIAGKSAEDEFTKKLKEMVEMVKQDAQTRMDYLLAKDRDRQLKEQWYDEGKEEGYSSGIYGAVKMLEDMNLSSVDIVKKLVSTYHIDKATAEKYLKDSERVTV